MYICRNFDWFFLGFRVWLKNYLSLYLPDLTKSEVFLGTQEKGMHHCRALEAQLLHLSSRVLCLNFPD